MPKKGGQEATGSKRRSETSRNPKSTPKRSPSRIRGFNKKGGFNMLFHQYQTEAGKTAVYNGRGTLEGLIYCTLGLVGEAGEVANKVKKINRDHGNILTEEMKDAIRQELGGVLWYISQVAFELDLSLTDIALENLQILRRRFLVDKIRGEGDNR